MGCLDRLDRQPPDVRVDVPGEHRLNLGKVVARPILPLLLDPFLRNCLEGIGRLPGGNQLLRSSLSSRVNALLDQVPSLVALSTRLLQRERRVLPDGEEILAASDAVSIAPAFGSCRLDRDEQPTPVGELVRSISLLRVANAGVRESCR